ncbi:MAG TPA: rhomboid family intramembrane serine protease [Anaerolineae bacterium]
MIPIRDRIPTRHFPGVTILLIVINVIVFGYEMLLSAAGGDPLLNRFIYTYGLVPARVATQGLTPAVLWTFISSMFLHGGWLHIIGNMLYLWIFGNNIEDVMGHFWFVGFYLICGLVANVAQLIMSWGANIPGIGASGAIAGVLAAYLIFFPTARVETLIFLGFFAFIRWIPAIILLGFWFVLQLFNGFTSIGAASAQGGTAYFAHIGGFVAGLILALPWLGRARSLGPRAYYG